MSRDCLRQRYVSFFLSLLYPYIPLLSLRFAFLLFFRSVLFLSFLPNSFSSKFIISIDDSICSTSLSYSFPLFLFSSRAGHIFQCQIPFLYPGCIFLLLVPKFFFPFWQTIIIIAVVVLLLAGFSRKE